MYRLRDKIRSLEHIDYMECAQGYTTSQTCKTQFGAPWVRYVVQLYSSYSFNMQPLSKVNILLDSLKF